MATNCHETAHDCFWKHEERVKKSRKTPHM